MPRLKLTPLNQEKRKVRIVSSDDDDMMRRYMVPTADDLPLLKEHIIGEWFERVDGRTLVRRWKSRDGSEGHDLIFYPAETSQHKYDIMEHLPDCERNDYFLLLWKMLKKFGIAKYSSVPNDVKKEDFDRLLNKTSRVKLMVKPERLKLKVNE